MKPITFPGVNATWAEDQPEYMPLPAINTLDSNGTVITCWELDEAELEEISKSRKVFVSTSTFNAPIQPLYLSTNLESLAVLPTAQEYFKAKVEDFIEALKSHDAFKHVALGDKEKFLMKEFAMYMAQPETRNRKPPFIDEIFKPK